jgi:hypothetical protein
MMDGDGVHQIAAHHQPVQPLNLVNDLTPASEAKD